MPVRFGFTAVPDRLSSRSVTTAGTPPNGPFPTPTVYSESGPRRAVRPERGVPLGLILGGILLGQAIIVGLFALLIF